MGGKKNQSEKPKQKKSEPTIMARGTTKTLAEVLQESIAEGQKAHETHLENGGLCQKCGDHPAEFPHGLLLGM